MSLCTTDVGPNFVRKKILKDFTTWPLLHSPPQSSCLHGSHGLPQANPIEQQQSDFNVSCARLFSHLPPVKRVQHEPRRLSVQSIRIAFRQLHLNRTGALDIYMFVILRCLCDRGIPTGPAGECNRPVHYMVKVNAKGERSREKEAKESNE